jgi:hypothetical protein
MTDIICAVQGASLPNVLGLSVQETLQQVYNLFQSNIILFYAGNPNGFVAGTTYQLCWDTVDQILYVCTTSGTAGPGATFGSSAFPVGFRGDGSIYPSTTGAGYWRPNINGTAYMIPLITDGATAWPAITTSSISFSSTSAIIGTTTNDSAAAGSVGEYVYSAVAAESAVGLTSTDITAVTSISLTAGDWDLWGNICYTPGGSTTFSYSYNWISADDSDLPDLSVCNYNQPNQTAFIAAGAVSMPPPDTRISLASTTTIYLLARPVFSVSTLTACGFIAARRRR